MIKTMAFDMPHFGKWRCLIAFVVFCSGCHWIFPFEPSTTDGNRSDGGVDSSLDVVISGDVMDGMADGYSSTDLDVGPDSSPCIFDDFNGPMSSWKVSHKRGSWSWHAPTSARQEMESFIGGHAMVQGSLPMVHGFVAKSIATVHSVFDNGQQQGAGLSLVISEGTDDDKPYRQVLCISWMEVDSTAEYVAVSYFTGGSQQADSFAADLLDFTIKGNPTTYTLEVTQDNNVWTATCTVASESGKSGKATADISSFVDSDPLGVALVTTGVFADFEYVQVCPVP